jgi:amino acid adenylation domain-containing protein
LHYDAALFDGEGAASFASRYVALLRNVVATPGAAIGRLDVTTEEERGRLLAAPWCVEGEYPVEECIHQLFERRAREHPGCNAVTFEGRHMTYGELDARADALARRLVRAGVGPESRVGVFAEPSHELVVALLAVLKAGGCYVPLDSSTPPQRVAAVLEGSGASALICQRSLAGLLPEGHAPTHLLDAEDATDEDDADEALSGRAALPDNLAYVIYTSGSTGTPKGVQVTHANVVRLLKATERWFEFGGRDVWTMFHSHAFDFSVWEMWGALLTGGRLVLVPQRVKTSPADLRELLRRERVTVLNQTPSVFRLLSQADAEADSSEPLSLRLVIFGGEALDPQSLGPWFERYGDERPQLVNMYGITETTVHVTYREMRRGDLTGRPQSPAGVPMPDLSAYVLDRHMNLAPRGAAGELYVGGAGVARGYLGRPDLTAERFVPDPFSVEPGARFYKSGDGVRMLAGDDLEYLGRIDQQVKIRGFRIELGEIEVAMRGCAGVKDAAVVCVEEGGEKRLVGFYAAADGEAGDGLRQFLSATLPAYMLPSRFVRLGALPVNVNGKTDRKALIELARAEQRSGGFVAPRTPVEEQVAEVWARLLGHERVGVEDHFFDLGGHSLLATQIVHGLREAFQVDVPLAWFFDGAPTVAGLAALIEARQIQSAEDAELADALAEIDALSDEEVRALLAQDDSAGAAEAASLEQV